MDAVCITGGEPTLYNELAEFISRIKQMGFLVKLDTNGTNPEMLSELLARRLVDYIAMDIKAPVERYSEITGVEVNIEKIKKSIEVIRNSGIGYEFRTTVFPELVRADFLKIGKYLEGSRNYFLQQFRKDKILDKNYLKEPYPDEKLREFCDMLKPFFRNCSVRGLKS